MFTRKPKDTRIERSFSIMLAEEILRAELEIFCEKKVQFFRCDITATQVHENLEIRSNISEVERDLVVRPSMRGTCFERYVRIEAIVGPFERCFSNNPQEDRRRELRRVEATCRLFTTESGARYWKPHFLNYVIKDSYGFEVHDAELLYEDGSVDGLRRERNAMNPCKDMVASQIPANYPMFHPELHGRQRSLRELQGIS